MLIMRTPLMLPLLLIVARLHRAIPFAAWLVDREVGCLTYLQEGEVIMNNEVVEASKSRYPDVHLQILRNGELQNAKQQGSNTIPFSASGETVQVRLATPRELEYADVQFVAETTKGAKFIGDNVGCEGQRSSAPRKAAELTLELSGSEEKVEVWAGFATGHEAVTLTSRVTLISEKEPQGELAQDLAAQKSPAVGDGVGQAETTTGDGGELLNEPKRTEEDSESRIQSAEDNKIAEALAREKAISLENFGSDIQNKPFATVDRQRERRHHKRRKEAAKRSTNVDRQDDSAETSSSLSRFGKLQSAYDRDDFGSASFSISNFVYACFFYISFTLVIVQYASKARQGQEKREL